MSHFTDHQLTILVAVACVALTETELAFIRLSTDERSELLRFALEVAAAGTYGMMDLDTAEALVAAAEGCIEVYVSKERPNLFNADDIAEIESVLAFVRAHSEEL